MGICQNGEKKRKNRKKYAKHVHFWEFCAIHGRIHGYLSLLCFVVFTTTLNVKVCMCENLRIARTPSANFWSHIMVSAWNGHIHISCGANGRRKLYLWHLPLFLLLTMLMLLKLRLWCEHALYFSTLIFHQHFHKFWCMFVQSNLSVKQTGFSFLSYWITIHQMPETRNTQPNETHKLKLYRVTSEEKQSNHKMRWMCSSGCRNENNDPNE